MHDFTCYEMVGKIFYHTFKKLLLVCQSTILTGWMCLNLSRGSWLPDLRFFAPASRTRVNWSPKHGALIFRNRSFGSGIRGMWANSWSGLDPAISGRAGGVWSWLVETSNASFGINIIYPSFKLVKNIGYMSEYFFSSFTSTGSGATIDWLAISSWYRHELRSGTTADKERKYSKL